MGDNDQGSREDAGSTQAGDGTADDEGSAGWGESAYERAEFEDSDGQDEGVLDGKERVRFAVEKLKRGGGEEVG